MFLKKNQILKFGVTACLACFFSIKLLACAEHSGVRIEGAQLGNGDQKNERCAMGGCLQKKDGLSSPENSSLRKPANNVSSDFLGSERPVESQQVVAPEDEKSRAMESRGPI